MKCKHCGANLIMDAAFCPYCGHENPYFKQHREEMAEYQEEFFDTRREVNEKTTSFKFVTIKTTIIAILVALNLLVVVGIMNIYNLSDWISSMYVKNNASKITEMLDTYEKEGNFLGISHIYYEYRLYGVDEFSSYHEVTRCANLYDTAYTTLCDWEESLSYFDSKQEVEKRVSGFVDTIEMLAKAGVQEEYDDPDCFTKEHMNAINKMKQNILVLLQQHFEIDQEYVTSFYDLSSFQREQLLQEGVIYHVE